MLLSGSHQRCLAQADTAFFVMSADAYLKRISKTAIAGGSAHHTTTAHAAYQHKQRILYAAKQG